MKIKKVLGAIVASSLFLGGVATSAVAAPLTTAVKMSAKSDASASAHIFGELNKARSAAKKKAVKRNSEMDAVALNWSKKMANTGVLSHNPSYSSQIPKGHTYSGENVAYVWGYPDAGAQLHANWMKSPGHKANILRTEFTHVGIGVFTAPDGKVWATQVFGQYAKDPAGTTAPPVTPAPKPTETPKPAPKPTETPKPAPKPTETPKPAPKPTATTKPAPKPTATTKPAPKPSATTKPAPKPSASAKPAPKPSASAKPAPKSSSKPRSSATTKPATKSKPRSSATTKPAPKSKSNPRSSATTKPAPKSKPSVAPAKPTTKPAPSESDVKTSPAATSVLFPGKIVSEVNFSGGFTAATREGYVLTSRVVPVIGADEIYTAFAFIVGYEKL